MSLRSERARRRAAKLRNQRIGLAVLGILALAGIGYLAWSAFGGPKASSNTTSSGLQIQDEVVGTGTEAKTGDTVSVQYTGWLMNGTKFDSSLDHGQPFQFTLGQGQVIPGWDEGVAGMKVGGKRILIVPPDLGYGAQANGPIPANSTLKFEVELLNVSASGQPSTTTQP